MDQLRHSGFLEAESMIDRLLGLKYFQGAQSSLDQLSLILRLLQQRDSRTSTKALLATQKGTAHVQPSTLDSVTDTEKPRAGKYSESATAGSNVRIDKPVDKELGRRSSNPEEPRQPSLLPVSSSSRGRSASESAIRTGVPIFSGLPGVPISVDDLSIGSQIDLDVRFTPSKEKWKSKELIKFITTEENITLKVFVPWTLPKRFKGTTLPEHLKQEIQEPIKRDVKAGTPHHGRIYMYWVQGNFGLVKIGYTTKTEKTRLKQWRSRCKLTPHPINLNRGYLDELPHILRVERLIHTELRDKRIREPDCSGCRKPHKEWFIVTNELAKQVTKKWCDWMQQCPHEKIPEKNIKKNVLGRVKEMWTLKQEHVDSLKVGELLFHTNEESSRRSSQLLEPVPAPAPAPPKLLSRLSQPATSPRPGIRKSVSAGRLSNPTPNFEGRKAVATSSDLLSPAHTPTPPERRRRSASQLN